jgi:hypothetical protein
VPPQLPVGLSFLLLLGLSPAIVLAQALPANAPGASVPAAAPPPTAVSPAAPTVSGRTLIGRISDRKMTLHLNDARLADVMAALAHETGLSVLSDAYPNDPRVPSVTIEQVPLYIAVERLSDLFQREPLLVGRVLVLRSKSWPIQGRKSPGAKWQSPAAGLGTLALSQSVDGTPALYGAVSNTAPDILAAEVSQVMHQPFIFDIPATERRVSLNAYRVTPLELAGGLQVLLNGTVAITISQTDEQRAREAALAKEMDDPRPRDVKASDELMDSLKGVLSPDQERDYAQGKEVDIPISDLPTNLQQMATDYANLVLDLRTEQGAVDGTPIDRNAPFTLNLKSQYATIGISGSLMNGHQFGLGTIVAHAQ